ncbi:MAG TPA: hypothetical protein VGL82_00940 [Bryobacteraceae bacterium]|jgi:hypothetical protein
MKKAVWCVFLTGAALSAQDASYGNAAAESLRKRLMDPNILKLNPPRKILLGAPLAAVPKVCSISLLNVIPPGTADKMPVTRPQGPVDGGGTVRVPAPACDNSAFTNRK